MLYVSKCEKEDEEDGRSLKGQTLAFLFPPSVFAFQSLVRFTLICLTTFLFGDPFRQIHIHCGNRELLQGVHQVQVDGGLLHLTIHQLPLQGGVVDGDSVGEDVRPKVLVVFHQGASYNHCPLKTKRRAPLQRDEKKILFESPSELGSTVGHGTLGLGSAMKVLSVGPRVPGDAPGSYSFSWFLCRLSLHKESFEGTITSQSNPEVLVR